MIQGEGIYGKEEILMEKNNHGIDLQNGVPLYVPALLLGTNPILIAGKFIPQTVPQKQQTEETKENMPPLFMPGGGSFPFPESM